jgi:hypothetical protein
MSQGDDMNTSLRYPTLAAALAAVSSLTACAHPTHTNMRPLAPTTAELYNCGATPSRGTIRRGGEAFTATAISTRTTTADRSAYDAVMRLRPEYLGARAPGGLLGTKPMTARVVIDDNCENDNLSILMRVPIDQIQLLNFIAPADAAMRYGSDYGGGVILIRTKQYRAVTSP